MHFVQIGFVYAVSLFQYADTVHNLDYTKCDCSMCWVGISKDIFEHFIMNIEQRTFVVIAYIKGETYKSE